MCIKIEVNAPPLIIRAPVVERVQSTTFLGFHLRVDLTSRSTLQLQSKKHSSSISSTDLRGQDSPSHPWVFYHGSTESILTYSAASWSSRSSTWSSGSRVIKTAWIVERIVYRTSTARDVHVEDTATPKTPPTPLTNSSPWCSVLGSAASVHQALENGTKCR